MFNDEIVSDKIRYTTSEVVEMLRKKSIELGSKQALAKAACVDPGFLSLVLSAKHDPNYLLVRYLGLKRMVYFYYEELESGDELKQNDKEFVEYEKSLRKTTKKLNSRDRKIAGLQRKVALLESTLASRTIDLQIDIQRAVERALCNVRMIPVMGSIKDRKIVNLNMEIK